MSVILTPYKSTSIPQFKRFSSTNYFNRHLQSSLIKEKTYTDYVNQLIGKSQQDDNVPNTPTRSYSESKIYRIYSRNAKQKNTYKNQTSESKRQIQVPQNTQMIDLLNKKARFIPDIREKFEDEMYEKLMLEQKMFELKRKIYQQRKTKDKVHLRNCKLINEHESYRKSIQIIKDQSRRNLVLICLLASECTQLVNQLEQTQKINRITSRNIDECQNIVSRLKKRIQNGKKQLDQQTSRLVQLKHFLTTQYKKMTNVYTQMNKINQERVHLLNQIKTDVQNHS